MIYKIDIHDATKTPVAWLSSIEAFKKPRAFEFEPGLNILWGRNGSGKTSLIKMLARLFHCEQGNQPLVTHESLSNLVGGGVQDVDLKKGLKISHDGQGVRHFDPGHAVGLMGGGAAFDWDFGTSGLANAMFKGSAGQTTMFRFDPLLEEIIADEVPRVEWKLPRAQSRPWAARVKLAEHFLEGNAERGQPTILLDEPERSYDLNMQISVWRFLRAYADQVQLIVASHSLFALKIPDAHYIELSPRYLAGSEAALEVLQKWSREKPAKFSEEAVRRARDNMKRAAQPSAPRGGARSWRSAAPDTCTTAARSGA